MTFREQALIAIATTSGKSLASHYPEAALLAQALAEEACKNWGHDFSAFTPREVESGHATCERCGAR